MTESLAVTTPSKISARTVAVVLGILAISAFTGAATPFGMAHLPRSIEAAANSSAPWAMIAFACVYSSRAERMPAAALGACSFVVMDVFFFVAYDFRGGYYPHHYLAFWLGIAVVIGPIVGLCASWLRSPGALFREIAVAAPSSILVGEGAYMLARLPGVSTPYAVCCVVGGLVLFGLLAGWRLVTPARIAASAALFAAGATAFFAIYSLLPLVLHKVVP